MFPGTSELSARINFSEAAQPGVGLVKEGSRAGTDRKSPWRHAPGLAYGLAWANGGKRQGGGSETVEAFLQDIANSA